MKTTSFKSFLSNYVLDMSPEQSLSLFKNEKHVHNDSRLLNVFSFYVFFNTKVVNTLLSKKKKLPHLFDQYTKYKSKYGNTTYHNVNEVVETLEDFDELKQLYTSYKNLYQNKTELLKKVYHQKINLMQHEKKISNYRIYMDLMLNPGNTNDFLKNKKYNKLSLDKVKSIHRYVSSV